MKKTLTIEEMKNLAESARAKENSTKEELDGLKSRMYELADKKAEAKAHYDIYACDKLEAELKTLRQTIHDKEEDLKSFPSFDRDLVEESWEAYLEENNAAIEAKMAAYMELKQKAADMFLEVVKLQQQANLSHFYATRLISKTVWEFSAAYNAASSSLKAPAGLPNHEARLRNAKETVVSADALAFAADGMIPSSHEALNTISCILRRVPVTADI